MEEILNNYKGSYDQFIRTVCQNDLVYGLQSEEEFATMWSNHFEDEEGNPIEVICFWSDPESAKACANEEWQEYQVGNMPLSDFIENWCVALHIDELMLGLNINPEMQGFEAEPLEVVQDIIAELKRIGRKPDFKKVKDLEDFERQVKEIME